MTFAQLAVVGLLRLLGPLLAYPRGWHLPVVLGELLAGIAVGRTGVGYLDAGDVTFTFLADIGFALVMIDHSPAHARRFLARAAARWLV